MVLSALRLLRSRVEKEGIECVDGSILFVTGAGIHSKIPGISDVREAVVQLLADELHLQVEVPWGKEIQKHGFNHGRLVIKAETLRQWFQRKSKGARVAQGDAIKQQLQQLKQELQLREEQQQQQQEQQKIQQQQRQQLQDSQQRHESQQWE